MQGGSHFSYNAVNFHPEVRIYWKTLPLAGWQSLFLHGSKLPTWSEILLKNLILARWQSLFLHCSNLPWTRQKKRNLNRSLQLVWTTRKKERPTWLWTEETEVCHKLTHRTGTYHGLSRARLHFGPCYWSIFLNVYLKEIFFYFGEVGQWKE